MRDHLRLGWMVGACLGLGSALSAAETCPVIAVKAPDHVVLKFQGLPVEVPLACIEVPADEAARSACQARLADLVGGKKVQLVWKASYGSDADGAACVQLSVNGTNVNVALVADGLARFHASDGLDQTLAKAMDAAQEKAKSAHQGIWAAPSKEPESAAPPATASAAPAAPAAPAATTPAADTTASVTAAPTAAAAATPPGPFCSELDSSYFYPSGSPAVANINPQRMIYYPDESSAQRAGKQPSPEASTETITSDGSEASADAIFAKGKEIYAEAIDAGNTPKRDQLYAQAFTVLTKAMQVYSKLCEASPDDEKLGEKLRVCMQLRYGSVKQRRFE